MGKSREPMTVEESTAWAAKASRKADRKMTAKSHRKAAEACAAAAKSHCDLSGKEGDENHYASGKLGKLATMHAATCKALGGKCKVGEVALSLAWTEEAREASIRARRATAAAKGAAKVADQLKSAGAAREAHEAHTSAAQAHEEAEAKYGSNQKQLKNGKVFAVYNEHNLAKLEHRGEAEKWKKHADEFTGKPAPKASKRDKEENWFGLAFDISPMALAFSDGDAWKLEQGNRYRKHILKLGKFVKKSDNLRFEITPREFDHFERTFSQMQQNGVKVPLPLGHTDDDHKNRGWVVGIERSTDDPNFLDAIIECDRPELIKENDVSVFVPPSFTDGEGNEYMRPIRHVALTPYPVIPGLGEFKAIAASFEDGDVSPEYDGSGADLSYEALLREAESLGEIADANDKMDDHRKAAFAYQRAADVAEKDGKDASNCRSKAAAHADEAGITLSYDEDDTDSLMLMRLSTKLGKPVSEDDVFKALKCADEPKPRPKKKTLKLAMDNRENRLRSLVKDGKATRAQVGTLAKVHCSRKAVTLSLSDDPEEAALSDSAFNAAVAALSMNPKNSLLAGEKSGPQTKMELANELILDTSNPLLADAEARAQRNG